MEKKKKLLVTASTFPRWEGDTEPRFVLDLAKYMKKVILFVWNLSEKKEVTYLLKQ